MTREELQDERAENEALRSAKEIAKRKSKNKMQKIIWHAVKAAVIPMLILMVKIMAVAILVCAVISMFQNILDGEDGETSTNEEFESTVSAQIGGMDITDSTWQFSAAQIEDFINNYDSISTSLKQEMLNHVEDIYNWQNNYGYSAGILIAIAAEDGITAEEFDDFLNEMDANGQKWKESGYKNVQEIAQDYVGDETANEWANNISNQMSKTAQDSGIITSGEYTEEGERYSSVYRSRTGMVYRNYKQILEEYKSIELANYPGYDFYNNGCAICSVTIIATGFGHDMDPIDMNEYYKTLGSPLHNVALSKYTGLNCYYVYNDFKSGVIEQLQRGYPVMVHVVGNSGRFSTNSGHFFVILDISSDGTQVYVSDPAAYNQNRNGWLPVSILDDAAFDKYMKME